MVGEPSDGQVIDEAALDPGGQVEAPALVVGLFGEGAERDLVGHRAALFGGGFVEQGADFLHEVGHDGSTGGVDARVVVFDGFGVGIVHL